MRRLEDFDGPDWMAALWLVGGIAGALSGGWAAPVWAVFAALGAHVLATHYAERRVARSQRRSQQLGEP
ncbi:hypothetical protein U9R90_27185 [Streptomyces sp. E11-3]|uniref:hypothetical protein n=1 Tax=Streptomyces sp. E11-3 TaxID=3110112 RepID=UPI00397EFAA3